MQQGYLIVLRKFFEHDFWTERRTFSRAEAWLDLLQLARWKEGEKETIIQGKAVTYGRGEVVRSIEYLARRWGWSKPRAQRFLSVLRQRNAIETTNETKATRITISHYSEYQKLRYDADNAMDPSQQRYDTRYDSDTIPDTISIRPTGQNNSEYQKLRYDSDTIPDTTAIRCRSTQEHKKYKKHKKEEKTPLTPLKKGGTKEALPAWMPVETWNAFKEHRRLLKAPMSPKAEQLTLKKLQAFMDAGQNPEEIINQSIEHGWKGVFALKGGNGKPSSQCSPTMMGKAGSTTWQNIQALRAMEAQNDKH